MSVKSQIVVTAVVLALLLNLGILSANAQVPNKAPQLPEREGDLPPRTGFVPPPMDLSHLTGEKLPERFKTLVLPIRWDWREQGKVTSFKDQDT